MIEEKHFCVCIGIPIVHSRSARKHFKIECLTSLIFFSVTTISYIKVSKESFTLVVKESIQNLVLRFSQQIFHCPSLPEGVIKVRWYRYTNSIFFRPTGISSSIKTSRESFKLVMGTSIEKSFIWFLLQNSRNLKVAKCANDIASPRYSNNFFLYTSGLQIFHQGLNRIFFCKGVFVQETVSFLSAWNPTGRKMFKKLSFSPVFRLFSFRWLLIEFCYSMSQSITFNRRRVLNFERNLSWSFRCNFDSLKIAMKGN